MWGLGVDLIQTPLKYPVRRQRRYRGRGEQERIKLGPMKPTSLSFQGLEHPQDTLGTDTYRYHVSFLETSPFYQVSAAGNDVPHGGKPGQTLLVDKNPQWVTRCDQHIDAHVKFKAINKERL